MGNGSGIGLGGGVTGVTGLGPRIKVFATAALSLAMGGCQSPNVGSSTKASFETDAQIPLFVRSDTRAGGISDLTTEWATIRLQADWNDLEAALEVAQTEAETAVVQEVKGAVRAARVTGTAVPSLRRTFELLSIAGESGVFVAEAERAGSPVASAGTHQFVLRAELHSANGPNQERAAMFVEAVATRLGQLAGVDAFRVPSP